LDLARNARVTDPQPGEVQLISSADAGISAYVVGVDEEAVIAGETLATVE
jgi:acetate kinase